MQPSHPMSKVSILKMKQQKHDIICKENSESQIQSGTRIFSEFSLHIIPMEIPDILSYHQVLTKNRNNSGVLTIYKNHPVGNFRHKHKTIKCEVAGVGIIIKSIHIS